MLDRLVYVAKGLRRHNVFPGQVWHPIGGQPNFSLRAPEILGRSTNFLIEISIISPGMKTMARQTMFCCCGKWKC